MRRTTKAPAVIYGLGEGEKEYFEQLAKSQVEIRTSSDSAGGTLTKSILNILDGQSQVHRLAFETDPSQVNNFAGVYHAKLRLVPDSVLKRIAIQDSLVAAVVRARQMHISQFGRPRPDRFSKGFIIKPNTGVLDKMSKEEKSEFAKKVERAVKLFRSCGHTEGVVTDHQKTLSEYLNLVSRSGVVCGRLATEIVWADDGVGNRKFSHFVAADAGTIYRATTDRTGQESIRKEAYHLLCKLTGKKLPQENWNEAGEYAWVQVIDGTPKQVFRDDEMRVYNMYPVPDVELDGYPVTPIDTVITAITTHVNIVTHNKMYFQSGRATRGMLVLESDDVTPQMIHQIKQQFNASINSVGNSWRMPVFGVPTGGKITWQPIDAGGGRDMEFQYLSDMNAREILTAFMMSPDELPGYSYLSRGTASQALSESNTEWKLTAARDVGIRPMIAQIEDFLNAEIFPLIDPELAKQATIALVGLEADTEEKESVKLQGSANVYLTFDDVLQKVEKEPMGKRWGGTIPLNPVYKAYLKEFFYVGDILEHFCGIEGASKDPSLHYINDQGWFQWQEMLQQQKQLEAQQQAQAQQAQGGGTPDGSGGGGGQADPNAQQGADGSESGPSRMNPQDDQTENQRTQSQEQSSGGGGALGKAIDQAFDLMQKSEDNLPPEKRAVLFRHKKMVDFLVDGFQKDVKEGTKELLDIARKLSPRK